MPSSAALSPTGYVRAEDVTPVPGDVPGGGPRDQEGLGPPEFGEVSVLFVRRTAADVDHLVDDHDEMTRRLPRLTALYLE